MSLLDVDTRSDIYSLGVLLYELLTGTTPIETARLREAGYAEIQRLIREVEPPRPSTRLSSLGDSATVVAGNRATDPKHLSRLLAGDLDWIVMKALEKDRNRRYSIAGELCRGRGALLAAGGDPGAAAVGGLSADEVRRAPSRGRAGRGGGGGGAARRGPRSPPGRPSWRRGPNTTLWPRRRPRRQAKQTRRGEGGGDASGTRIRSRTRFSPRPGPRDATAGSVRTSRFVRPSTPPCRSWKKVSRISLSPRPGCAMTLGNSFWYLGDGKAAAAQYEPARAICTRLLGPDHPDTIQCLIQLGISYGMQGRTRESVELYEEILPICKASSARTPGKRSSA